MKGGLKLKDSLAYCVKERKPCVGWVEKYFKDCLCNPKDDLSFSLGIVSLVCWGVAEIPQIITNFRTKSSHGVSLLFLLTWVAGDVFNIVGCLLEPATLPTQYYTALLYTTSTVVLVFQSLYYDHIYSWWKCRHIKVNDQAIEEEIRKPLKPPKPGGSGIPISSTRDTSKPFYYTSARSLAGSYTPPVRSYLSGARSGPTAMGLDNDSSSDDETIQVASHNSSSQPKPIPRSAGYAAFLATSVNLPKQSMALMQVYAGFTGRKLLHEQGGQNDSFGQWLGWMMAAIYIGGRIPQIWLNIKRGSVEGLNPFMFIFALIANVTYVGSILVRNTEWDKIKANMPWLLDALVCVGLDVFIILQYVYYRYIQKMERNSSGTEYYGDYKEANKAILS